jgi:putative SOS response-associated peptidase YedK
MCGRFTLATATASELRQRFPISESVELERRFNVAPGDDVVAIRARHGVTEASKLRWGFTPPWAKDPSVGFKMINARAETLAEKPAYRDAFKRHRCLIVADGFFEWRREGVRQPFHVTRADGAPFAFAGLWTGWKDPATDEWLRSCTIVTTQSNEAIAAIHPRMPVILPPEVEETWLDPDASPEHLRTLLAPLASVQTRARAVSKAVNDARYDGPECLADAEPEAAAPAPAEAEPPQEALF